MPVRPAATAILALGLGGCASAPPLRAPVPVAPTGGAIVRGFPRTVHFEWRPVEGASRYAIEIDCFHCCRRGEWCSAVGGATQVVRGLKRPSYTMDYVGDQPGRWRVWAESRGRAPALKSEWQDFVCASRADDPRQAVVSPEGVVPPRAIHAPKPAPAGVSGVVLVKVQVNEQGLVVFARVESSTHSDLDARAVQAIYHWRYEPARDRDGRPVAAWLNVSVSFDVR